MKEKTTLIDGSSGRSESYQSAGDSETRGDSESSFVVELADAHRNRILNKDKLPNLYGSFESDSYKRFKVGNELAHFDSYENYRRKSSLAGGVSVADIIGSFGWFQLVVLIFSGLREATVGYDAVVMSIILQPETKFVCVEPRPTAGYRLNSTVEGLESECYHSLGGKLMLRSDTGSPIRCHSWSFPERDFGASLTAEWGLVCHRHWLAAFIESAYFLGLVAGNLCWGFSADKIGRRRAYLISHTISALSGCLSILAPNIWLFSLCRFCCAFGSIGYNIIYSLQVELIGTRHRAFSTILNHLGWGLGVILVPLVDHIFVEHTPIISVAPVITLLMFPLAFWLPESPRWLMANDKYSEARVQLIRAARFNGRSIDHEVEKKLTQLEQKIKYDKMVQDALNQQSLAAGEGEQASGFRRMLAENPILLKDTIILAFTAFVGHLSYYLLTINFGYVKNLSTDANFIISGAGEWFSVAIGAVLLKFCSRRTCMTLFLLLMTCSFVFQAILDAEMAPSLDSALVTTLNNGVGTLSALLLVFIALIVNQEIFPTLIRQTGSSLVNTLGESGSTLAPLVIQLGLLMGGWQANMLYASVCFVAMVCTTHLSRTDDIDLPDT